MHVQEIYFTIYSYIFIYFNLIDITDSSFFHDGSHMVVKRLNISSISHSLSLSHTHIYIYIYIYVDELSTATCRLQKISKQPEWCTCC